MEVKPFNYLVYIGVAFCLVELSFGFNPTRYTKPSKEVGKRLKSYNPKKSPGYPQEYGFGYYYQGDILLVPNAQGRFAVNPTETNMWPNATVPYVIDANFTVQQTQTLETAFAQYANRTCIQFVPRTNETQYVNITNKETGCFSNVGRNPIQFINKLNLQTPSCMSNVGTPVHEMMHTLGFFHEHTRPDRDDYVIILYQNLDPSIRNNPGRLQANFGKLDEADGTNYGVPYNYGSVMHYSRRAGSPLSNPKTVFINKTPYTGEFGNSTGLSASDVEQLNARYCEPNLLEE